MIRTLTLATWTMAMTFLFAGVPSIAEPGSSLDAFDWLEGAWEREVDGGISIEEWKRVSPDTFEGIATMQREGEVRITEHLRIERFGERIYYVALPAENAMPTPFELVHHEEGRWVFENPDYEFPTRIVYLRLDASHLRVRIEDATGEQAIHFDFARR